jgi:tetratricopeptide (TPR) repeat protein
MSLSNNEEKAVRSYLLGELGPQETQALEERLLREENFVEQLLLLEDELIEDYVRGALTPGERARFESDFLSTPKRRRKLMLIKGIRNYADRRPAAAVGTRDRAGLAAFLRGYLLSPRWGAVALAVLLVAAGVGAWGLFSRRSEVDRGMLALNDAYKRQRPLEARVTGLAYAPFVTSRGNAPGEVDYRARDLSAALLLDAASKEQSASALHAAGRLYMAQKEFDKAVPQLQAALRLSPDDAGLHSDMGAALLEMGRQEEQSGDAGKALESYAQSLEYLNKASRLDPNLLEPLYNRALVLERQMLPEQAKEAWQLYLQHDARSKWADEARQHLKLLSERSAVVPTPQQLMEGFLAAMRARDDERAWQVMSRNLEMISGKFLPQRIAVAYLKEEAEGNQGERDEMLRALAYAGRLELERAHDPYVSDVAAYYARSSADRRPTLGQAQAKVSEGYDLCLRARFRESLEQFLRAKELFERVGDELEGRLCDYWAGYCYSQLDWLGRSTDTLRALAEYCRKNHYRWLLCQATCWMGTNYAEMGEHSKAVESYNRALAIAEDTGDDYIRQKALSQLASQYNQLGQPQRALDYNWRSLQLATSGNTSVRQLWRDYVYTARTFINLSLYDAAAAFGGEMLRLARDEIREADVLHDSYHYLGSIYGGMKQYDEAIRLTSESLNIARSLDGAAARKQGTYSLLQLAHLQRQAGRCEQALDSYDQAIQVYDQMELGAYKYDARKGRLLCYVALKRDAEIEAELPVVLEQFRQYRSKIAEEQNRDTFFDREQSVYDIAIDYAYTKGDAVRAFDYSEASRARSLLDTLKKGAPDDQSPAQPGPAEPSEPLGLSEIQGRIPDAVQVVQYAVLEDKTLIWLVTKDSVRSAKSDIPAAELRAKILAFVNGISTPPGGLAGRFTGARRGALRLTAGAGRGTARPAKGGVRYPRQGDLAPALLRARLSPLRPVPD